VSDRVEQLISDLARDVRPVRVLPRLRWVAAGLLAVAALLCAVYVRWGISQGTLMPGSAGLWDFAAICGHLLIGAGGLALALGSCVPGRDRLELRGLIALGLGALVTAMTAISVLALVPLGIGGAWLAGTAECTGKAVAMAAVPALLLARFAAHGAPHRLGRTLVFGAVSMLGLGTLPGHIGCAMPGAVHAVSGHLLVPVTGAVVVYAVMRAGYLRPVPAS
jgi:hypothetical protein